VDSAGKPIKSQPVLIMEYKNWILNKYKDVITPVFKDFQPYYADFLINNGIHINKDLSKVESFIEWEKYDDYHSFWYYFVGCELAERLKDSELMRFESVIMDFGNGEPVFEISANVFVDNWLDFVTGARYLTTVVTKKPELIMEFIKGDIINSNFKI
jgi:hypothetical protein